MSIASIGIDQGKTTFHPVALGERNKVAEAVTKENMRFVAIKIRAQRAAWWANQKKAAYP